MKQYTYDLVILDYQMPDMDGIETLQEIRKLSPEYCRTVPAICLTANAVEGAREQYLKAGFTDYMTKPIRPEMLEKIVMKYLPQDKVEKVTKQDEKSVRKIVDKYISEMEETTCFEFPEWVFQIDALNVFSAIEFCGSPEMFFTSLKMFIQDSGDLLDELIRQKEAGDGEKFAVCMHKMKSNSRLIGFDCASRLAELLEMVYNRGDMDAFWNQTEDIIDMIRDLRKEIQKFSGKDGDLFVPEKDGKGDDAITGLSYEETIRELKALVESFDYDGTVQLAENLERITEKSDEKEKFVNEFRSALDEINWDRMQALIR
jgi:CheY-like chemotaxis protein